MGGGETVEWTKPCCAVFWYTGSRRPHAPGARSWRPARTGPHPASKIARWLRLGACRSPLSGKLGRDGKEPLMAGARGLIVVNKFAPTFPQLHDRHVGQGTNVERPAIIDDRERARCIDGRTRSLG